MTAEWRQRDIQLSCLVSTVKVFKVTFRGLALYVPCEQLLRGYQPPEVPLPGYGPELQTAVIYSHPEQVPLPDPGPDYFRYVSPPYRRLLTDLGGTLDDYLKRYNKKKRYNLLRTVRRFAEFSGGTITWREYRRPGEMAEFHQRACDVAQKTSLRHRLMGTELPAGDGFRKYLEKLAERDAVRGYLLTGRDQPAAYVSSVVIGNALVYDYIGYDPALAEWSPGVVLHYKMLEHLFAEGRFRWFDFNRGDGPLKERFATHDFTCVDVYLLRNSAWNRAKMRAYRGVCGLARVAGAAARPLGLNTLLGRQLRRHLLGDPAEAREASRRVLTPAFGVTRREESEILQQR